MDIGTRVRIKNVPSVKSVIRGRTGVLESISTGGRVLVTLDRPPLRIELDNNEVEELSTE